MKKNLKKIFETQLNLIPKNIESINKQFETNFKEHQFYTIFKSLTLSLILQNYLSVNPLDGNTEAFNGYLQGIKDILGLIFTSKQMEHICSSAEDAFIINSSYVDDYTREYPDKKVDKFEFVNTFIATLISKDVRYDFNEVYKVLANNTNFLMNTEIADNFFEEGNLYNHLFGINPNIKEILEFYDFKLDFELYRIRDCYFTDKAFVLVARIGDSFYYKLQEQIRKHPNFLYATDYDNYLSFHFSLIEDIPEEYLTYDNRTVEEKFKTFDFKHYKTTDKFKEIEKLFTKKRKS